MRACVHACARVEVTGGARARFLRVRRNRNGRKSFSTVAARRQSRSTPANLRDGVGKVRELPHPRRGCGGWAAAARAPAETPARTAPRRFGRPRPPRRAGTIGARAPAKPPRRGMPRPLRMLPRLARALVRKLLGTRRTTRDDLRYMSAAVAPRGAGRRGYAPRLVSATATASCSGRRAPYRFSRALGVMTRSRSVSRLCELYPAAKEARPRWACRRWRPVPDLPGLSRARGSACSRSATGGVGRRRRGS